MAVPQRFLRGHFVAVPLFEFLLDLDHELNRLHPCDLWVESHKWDCGTYEVYTRQGSAPIEEVNNLRLKHGMRAIAQEENKALLPECGKFAFRLPHMAVSVYFREVGKDAVTSPSLGHLEKAFGLAGKKHPTVCHSKKFPFVFWIKKAETNERKKA